MIEKQIAISQITMLEDGQIQVQQVTRIIEDGIELSHSFHRHVLHPGQSLVNEDPRVRAHAALAHTPTVIAAWNTAEAARRVP